MNTDSVTKSTFASGVLLALVGALAIIWLIPTHVVGADGGRDGLTPAFMPSVAAWCMIVLGGVVGLNAFRVILGQIPPIVEESEENEHLAFGSREVGNILVVGLLAAIYLAGVVGFGFLVPSAILLGLLMWATGYRRVIPIILISIGFPAVLEYLLWTVLQVPLPQFPLIDF